MARPEGFEPPTAGFEDQNSSTELRTEKLVLPTGNDPVFLHYQCSVIPLYYESLASLEGIEPPFRV